jgi:transketolase
LKNFMLIIDENGFQAMGTTEEVLKLGSLDAKFKSFGFETLTIDGHDEKAIAEAVAQLWASASPAPKALIAKTVKGKGVPFMEHNNMWHYTRLNAETHAAAVAAVTGVAA